MQLADDIIEHGLYFNMIKYVHWVKCNMLIKIIFVSEIKRTIRNKAPQTRVSNVVIKTGVYPHFWRLSKGTPVPKVI